MTEPLELRWKDVDMSLRRLVICGAKRGKDRMVELPRVLVEDLAASASLQKDRKFEASPIDFSFDAHRATLQPRVHSFPRYEPRINGNDEGLMTNRLLTSRVEPALTPPHLLSTTYSCLFVFIVRLRRWMKSFRRGRRKQHARHVRSPIHSRGMSIR